MCNENNKNTNNCMYEILKTILVLQKEANMPECCLDTCDKKCLGCTPCTCCCNTRPITIYTCGCCNTKLALPITKDPNETVTSSVFRIEKLDDNCATFRVLVATVNDGVTTYTATDSFFTINLNCVCVLKCLNDTYIECI
jgi:hypothetical protein